MLFSDFSKALPAVRSIDDGGDNDDDDDDHNHNHNHDNNGDNDHNNDNDNDGSLATLSITHYLS